MSTYRNIYTTGVLPYINKLCVINVNPDKYKETCLICNANVKEDTPHLLLHCKGYKHERERFLDATQIQKSLKTKTLDDEILMNVILGGDKKNILRYLRN